MKKNLITFVIVGTLSLTMLAGCGTGNKTGNKAGNKGVSKSAAITVVSREDGSGTRGAFIELFKIQEKDAKGNKIDHTTKDAVIANKTDVMLTQVSGNKNAIGYVSLGSLNNTVKAVKIDGVDATVDNVKNAKYKISRPFVIVTKGTATGLKADFVMFILSKEGQTVIKDNKYIPVNEKAATFKTSNASGKLVVAGSSSVTPVMEKLVEKYKTINKKATVEVQQSDSTTGINAAIDGTADVGMSSRDLTDAEKAKLVPTKIALDGIAVIVNKANSTKNFTSKNVKEIYTGKIKKWGEVK